LKWVSYDEWIVFKVEKKEPIDTKLSKNVLYYVKYKVRKRGNDVYANYLNKKVKKIAHSLSRLVKANRYFTNTLFMVLTYPFNSARAMAWWQIDEEFNDFINGIRKRYGDIVYFRTKESTLNGYPHINLIIVFLNRRFPIKKHKDKDGIERWRLRSYKLKEELTREWRYFTDVQALNSVELALNYCIKYATKDVENILKIDEDPAQIREKAKNDSKYEALYKSLLGFAIMWYLRKRVFSCSLDLINHCNRLMHNYSYSVDNLIWSVIGIYNKDEINMFLMWLCKVKKYLNIIVDDNLLTEMIYIQKLKIKQKEMTSLEKLKQISSMHHPLISGKEHEKNQINCSPIL